MGPVYTVVAKLKAIFLVQHVPNLRRPYNFRTKVVLPFQEYGHVHHYHQAVQVLQAWRKDY